MTPHRGLARRRGEAVQGFINFFNPGDQRCLVGQFESWEDAASEARRSREVPASKPRGEIKKRLAERHDWFWTNRRSHPMRTQEPSRFPGGHVPCEPGDTPVATNDEIEYQAYLLQLMQTAALDAVPQGVAITDVAGRIVWANRAFAPLYGYAAAEVAGRELCTVAATARAQAIYRKALAGALAGETWKSELVDFRHDGAPCCIDLTVAPVRSASGEVVAMASVHQDAAWRQNTEAELAYERKLLRTLMDSVPDSIYFKDRQSRFTLINRAQAELLGIDDPAEACGKTDWDYFLSAFAEQAYNDEQVIFRTGEAQVSKPERVERFGFSRWVTSTKVPMRNEQGAVIGLVGLSRDVTAFKSAEELLRRSEEFFRLLFEAIPHPVWVCQAGTRRILRVNAAALNTYGYTAEEFRQFRVCDIEAVGAPAREGVDTGARRHRTKSGHVLDVEVGEHAFDLRGHKALLVIVQDVSRRKQLEVELRHAQRLEAVGGLAAGIAHEINTPIQYVGDNLHFLQDSFQALRKALDAYETAREPGEPNATALDDALKAADLAYLNEQVPECIAQSLEGIERVAKIVRAMKEFAHPGREEKQAADLNHALNNALIVTRNELKYVAEVETDFGALPPVACYIAELNQVFLNLLVNAADAVAERRAREQSQEPGRIQVSTRLEGDHVAIRVSDSGCGIAPEIQARVFEPFFTTKEVGKGSGQGLAIARSIVKDKHAGTLSFTSRPGVGTTFTILLPIADAGGGEVSEELKP
jgi:PAS domain S-box-containing protein